MASVPVHSVQYTVYTILYNSYRTYDKDYYIIVSFGLVLDSQDDKNATPLHWAVAADNEIGVEYLLSRGANPTIANNNGECPIHACVQMESVKAMKTLIKHKVH